MKVHIYVKGTKEPKEFEAERIDIKDYNLEGVDYKQVRTFKRGFSKSIYIKASDIVKIKEFS